MADAGQGDVDEPRFEETDRKLLERIAYHERKIAEERAARGESAA